MGGNELIITARKRQDPLGVASPADFELSEGAAIDPGIVVSNPRITLYCLDPATRRGFFVENAPGADLSQSPFWYQAQYDNTIRLFAVDYETMHQLASQIILDGSQLIFLHSVGRTGSTLVDAVLNAVDGVIALSEPDVFTQLVELRDWDGSNDTEITTLTETCVKLICKRSEQVPNPTHWVLKFRSFCIELGDLLYAHFPKATNVFLYRHLESYFVSAMCAFVENEDNLYYRKAVQNWLRKSVPSIYEHTQSNGALLTVSAMVMMMWLRVMERYVELTASGMPGMAFRFEDVKAAPQATTQKIIEYCGLSMINLDALNTVLERDSQGGSAVSQEKLKKCSFSLTDAHKAEMAEILRSQSVVRSADFIAPTTWLRK